MPGGVVGDPKQSRMVFDYGVGTGGWSALNPTGGYEQPMVFLTLVAIPPGAMPNAPERDTMTFGLIPEAAQAILEKLTVALAAIP
jgi:hypothetical protein